MSDTDTTQDTADETVDQTSVDDQAAAESSDSEKDWKAEAEKWQRLSRENERKANRDYKRAQDLEAKLAGNANKPEGEQADPEKIREEARAEAKAEALADRVLDKIEAKAARDFEHPEDVSAFLRSQAKDFIDGGEIDAQAIDDALVDLREKRPGWLIKTDDRRFKGGGDGGARKETSRTTAEQIADAEKAGDWTTARRLKTQQLVDLNTRT